jgi:zinc metalloprotease ZmpB
VPSDNNIAMRALIPVPGGGGRCALEAAFCNRRFWAQNPFGKTARMELRVVMPPLLASRGWALRFANPGGANFMLGARGEREIRPVLMSGRDFDPIDVVDAGSAIIGVLVLADGIVVGGLSFALDAAMTEPAREREPCEPKHGRQEPKDDPDCGKPMKPVHRLRCCCEPCIDDRCRKPCCWCCEDKKPCDDKPAEDDGCDAEPR